VGGISVGIVSAGTSVGGMGSGVLAHPYNENTMMNNRRILNPDGFFMIFLLAVCIRMSMYVLETDSPLFTIRLDPISRL